MSRGSTSSAAPEYGRGPGAQVPGVIVAGTFHHEGDRVFWDVHDPAKAVVIHLADERYAGKLSNKLSSILLDMQEKEKTSVALRKKVR